MVVAGSKTGTAKPHPKFGKTGGVRPKSECARAARPNASVTDIPDTNYAISTTSTVQRLHSLIGTAVLSLDSVSWSQTRNCDGKLPSANQP